MNKLKIVFSVVILSGIFISSCKKPTTTTTTSEQTVETRLNAFVLTLVSNPPTSADIANRVKLYMLASPEFFYGSTVTLLDSTGAATYSPYWYRSADSLLTTDLVADTAYNINQQTWLRQPIDGGAAIWTAPYFDTGGGNIWMKTRAVPVIINGKIIAIATTDLQTQ